jgi:hypothetical protein
MFIDIKQFALDNRDLEQVIDLAHGMSKSGEPMVVVKQPDRDYYNIRFKSRMDLYKSEWVVWPPKPFRQ